MDSTWEASFVAVTFDSLETAGPVLQTRTVFTSHTGFHLAELLNDVQECLSQTKCQT